MIKKRRCKICNAILCGYNKDDVCYCHNESADEMITVSYPICCTSRGYEKFLFTLYEYNGGHSE